MLQVAALKGFQHKPNPYLVTGNQKNQSRNLGIKLDSKDSRIHIDKNSVLWTPQAYMYVYVMCVWLYTILTTFHACHNVCVACCMYVMFM